MLQVSKLNVLNDLVLIEGIKPDMRKGVVVGVTTDDKPQEGRVMKTGPGKLLDSGKRADMSVHPGMEVLFNEHTTTKFNIDGHVYYVLHEEDVVAYQ